MFRQKRRIGLKRLAVASLLLAALTPALAQQLAEAPPEPAWTTNFATACVMDAPQWRISSGLDKHVREQRLRCLPRDGGRNDGRILRIAIEPGDGENTPAYRIQLDDEDGPDIGGAWKRVGERAGDYIALEIDSPLFPALFRPALFQADDEGRTFRLAWKRPRAREDRG